MTLTLFHTPFDVGPYTRAYVSHREWRLICGQVGSPTRLMMVNPHLEFSSFGDPLSLVVPTTIVLLPKRMISLEAGKAT